MRCLSVTVLALCSLFLLSPAPLPAHHHGRHHCSDCCGHSHACDCGHATPGGCPGCAPARARTEQSVSGTITEVIYLPGDSPDEAPVEIRVKTASGDSLVRLGPAGFLRERGFEPREGAKVQVTGFPVRGPDGLMLVATKLEAGGRAVRLRNSRGAPLW